MSISSKLLGEFQRVKLQSDARLLKILVVQNKCPHHARQKFGVPHGPFYVKRLEFLLSEPHFELSSNSKFVRDALDDRSSCRYETFGAHIYKKILYSGSFHERLILESDSFNAIPWCCRKLSFLENFIFFLMRLDHYFVHFRSNSSISITRSMFYRFL